MNANTLQIVLIQIELVKLEARFKYLEDYRKRYEKDSQSNDRRMVPNKYLLSEYTLVKNEIQALKEKLAELLEKIGKELEHEF